MSIIRIRHILQRLQHLDTRSTHCCLPPSGAQPQAILYCMSWNFAILVCRDYFAPCLNLMHTLDFSQWKFILVFVRASFKAHQYTEPWTLPFGEKIPKNDSLTNMEKTINPRKECQIFPFTYNPLLQIKVKNKLIRPQKCTNFSFHKEKITAFKILGLWPEKCTNHLRHSVACE